jgi:signal transduction histidine kinase
MTGLNSSIRKKLLLSFLAFSILTSLLAIVAYFQIESIRKVSKLAAQFSEWSILCGDLFRNDIEFLEQDTRDTLWYKSQATPRTKSHKAIIASLHNKLTILSDQVDQEQDLLEAQLDQFMQELVVYDRIFDTLLTLHATVGYKDFGLEGQMREIAHTLEDPAYGINTALLLQLRRHEKDYLIRREAQYINKFRVLLEFVRQSLDDKHKDTEDLLLNYESLFLQIVRYHGILGSSSGSGFNGLLRESSNKVLSLLKSTSRQLEKSNEAIVSRTYTLFIIAVGIILLFSIGMGAWLADKFAEPLERLSHVMDRMVLRQFNVTELNEDPELKGDEISKLSQSFVRLIVKLRNQLAQLEQNAETLEQQNKELKALNTELDHLVYKAAHDLRAPLTSLLGLIDITKREFGQNGAALQFKMMEDSIRKLDNYISDIVDYATYKRVEPVFEKVDFRELVQDILSEMVDRQTASGVECTLLLEEEPPMLVTDRQRLRIVLSALFSNAFVFADKAKRNRYVRLKTQITPTEYSINIEDNGVGIAAAHKDKVFDMFYRASYQSKGSGLGLFIVKETVHALQGSIELTSEERKGTAIKILLPNKASLLTSAKMEHSKKETWTLQHS